MSSGRYDAILGLFFDFSKKAQKCHFCPFLTFFQKKLKKWEKPKFSKKGSKVPFLLFFDFFFKKLKKWEKPKFSKKLKSYSFYIFFDNNITLGKNLVILICSYDRNFVIFYIKLTDHLRPEAEALQVSLFLLSRTVSRFKLL